MRDTCSHDSGRVGYMGHLSISTWLGGTGGVVMI